MKSLKVLIASLLVLSCSSLYAQRSSIEKANLLYKIQSYAEAIPLYEKALNEKESLPARTKLAHAYQMLNQMSAAESEYKKIIHEERTKAIVFLRYGQVLMSLERYDEAKEWFLKYQQLEPDKVEGFQLAKSCDEIPFVKPLFPNVYFEAYPFNTDLDDTSPVFYDNGMVFSSDRNPGIKFLKQKSAATGRDYLRLYYAELSDDGSYKAPRSFSSKLNELNKNTATASFTKDGSEVYYTKNGSIANRRNAYTMQLFSAMKSSSGKWKSVKQLDICRPNYNYMHPCISPDGQQLFFTTDKPSGEGGTDIYYSVRKKDGSWSKPRNLGPNINTSMNEGFPFLHSNGKLYFCSKGHVGYGGYDIFVSEKNEAGQWQPAINIGKPFNSSHDDVSIYLKPDNKFGFFTSSREGGDDDIYFFEIKEGPIENINAVESTKNLMKDTVKPDSENIFNRIIDVIMQVYSQMDEPTGDPRPESHPMVENNEVNTTKVMADDALLVKKEAHEQLLEDEMAMKQRLENKVDETPSMAAIDIDKEAPVAQLLSLGTLKKLAKKGQLRPGMYCVLDGIKYFPKEYLLDPSKTKHLVDFASLLNDNPGVKVEISAHTVSIGYDENNLEISEKRAKAIFNYLLYKGIAADRINYIGLGETQLVNHCGNGVVCTEEEHMANQRIEVRIIE